MKIKDLAVMAEAVYNPGCMPIVVLEKDNYKESLEAGTLLSSVSTGTGWNSFQAAVYEKQGRTVVAFRGTTGWGDLVSDAALSLGMNSDYYEQAESFVRRVGRSNLLLCGHSLGGAIAQVVANRMNLPMVSFNAPGVAVLASRNILSSNLSLAKARALGMALSAVVQPGQALKDIRSAFTIVRGMNVCLSGDLVSRYGVHYGQVFRTPGESMNPKTEHSMKTVIRVLRQDSHSIGNQPAVF